MKTSMTSERAASVERSRRRLVSWGSADSQRLAIENQLPAAVEIPAFRKFEFHPSLNLARHAAPLPAAERGFVRGRASH
jgi:hypothetical protein